MAFTPFKRQRPKADKVEVSDFDALQSNLDTTLRPMTSKPHLDSIILESVALTAGVENWIEHRLGRVVRGWIIHDITVPAMVWRVSPTTAPSEFLSLSTTFACTLKLEVW